MVNMTSTGFVERRNVKAAIYIRVSTEEQAKEGISLKAQEERCKAFCIAKGWEVYNVFKDKGFSAGTMNRPALNEMIQDAKDKKFRVIVVYKIDRFSRKLKDLILTLENIRSVAVNFSSVTEQIDTTTAMGEAFFQIIGVFAQLERGMVKERVEMAFHNKISSGESLNRPPFGYKYAGKRLVIIELDAQKVRDIFEMKLAGVNYKEICNTVGIPPSTFYDILKNPVYFGMISYRGKLFKGNHKPIISKELWDSVNPKKE